jgi:uncharacterized repeat protein (TIGR03806 family)
VEAAVLIPTLFVVTYDRLFRAFFRIYGKIVAMALTPISMTEVGRRIFRRPMTSVLICLGILALLAAIGLRAAIGAGPYGLDQRSVTKAYLNMPDVSSGHAPRLLSETGAFADVRTLTVTNGVIPYDLAVSFWSDGAGKSRWISVPEGKIKFAPTGEWTFPRGTVFVKHFDLATDQTNPHVKRRLETRLLVCDARGGVYGLTYKWRADDTDADLLYTNLTEAIPIRTSTGVRTQLWYYPSPADCLVCHNSNAGGVMGVKTRQMNRDLAYPTGITDNQLRTWNHLGLFEPAFAEADLPHFKSLARADDPNRSLEERARSYLDANCSQCHRPAGTVATFDARYDTPLAKQGLIEGSVLLNEGIDHPRIVAPHDIWRSILYMRASADDALKMPPLAHLQVDTNSMALLRNWIQSMPGPDVLAPPQMSPPGGKFDRPITVTLLGDPGAEIRFTMDGTLPTRSDLLYEKPLELTGPTILRARTFQPDHVRSIVSQEVYVINQKP